MNPWYTFNRIDNFGSIDPQGQYFKPDSNILTPPGYPITALLPGTVTSVARTGWGQTVVTIKLDQPLNPRATHYYYEHMHSAAVYVGQRVAPGDLIGNANLSGEGANLGFGLYSGDVFGSGPAWDVLQQDLAPGGPGLLNPTPLLNQAKGGNGLFPGSTGVAGILPPVNAAVSGATGAVTQCQPWDLACMLNNAHDTIISWSEHIAIFTLAIVLMLIGIYLLAQKQVDQVASGAVKAVAAA